MYTLENLVLIEMGTEAQRKRWGQGYKGDKEEGESSKIKCVLNSWMEIYNCGS